MGLPKDKVKPAYNFTYPSEKDYFDDSKASITNATVTDTTKSGVDYGIKDPQVTEEVTGGKSETGKVGA
ncbi:hypothetical protein LU293_04245 [Moraxella nasovis]|uniref:hypothetical protein n=1 Tax=Moraxella nasovis TaxID=2904121 RepID=UPI001F61906D|nr:hypothetical protein [Moraxella nasovis]UNU74113.1 hypothetical protein LU293_04245 [Moraxella nasovis]